MHGSHVLGAAGAQSDRYQGFSGRIPMTLTK
jgi:hypothetical protein